MSGKLLKLKKKGKEMIQSKTDKSNRQTTISKFFSSSSKRKAASEEEVVDDNYDYSEIRREKQVPGSTSRKKTKFDVIQTDDAGLSACIKSKGNSPVIARVKQKLQNFSAVDVDSIQTDSIESFDFNSLKREAANRLSDVHLSTTNTDSDKFAENKNEVNLDVEESTEESEKFEKTLSRYSSDKLSDKGSGNKGKARKAERPIKARALTVKYTPLELQYMDLRDKYKDAVLFVECGYKYRFFGKDAEIASKVLKIYAYCDHNFLTASIPVHRLFVHVSRIVSAGYKVGVVQQMETAALKAAGSNKSAPFTRQLTALYTKSTMIGEDIEKSGDGVENIGSVSMTTSYLMCIYEQGAIKGDQKTTIGIMAVQPSTGDVVYDSFEDSHTRLELETRLTHIQPVEVILPSDISTETEKLLSGFQTICYHGDDRMRIEKQHPAVVSFNEAFTKVSQFYQQTTSSDSSRLQMVINLPQPVICCLATLIDYLQDFRLDKILREVGNFCQFSTKSSYMQLDSCTVRNLELFQNVTNHTLYGSLYWVINQTSTAAGARLLKTWLSRPLLSLSEIRLRQEAVAEILEKNLLTAQGLRSNLSRLPDLERKLASAYHKKCSPSDFYSMCEALMTIHDMFRRHKKNTALQLSSNLLRTIVEEIPELLSDIGEVLDMIDGKAAKENDKTNMFSEEANFPEVVDCKEKMREIKEEIDEHRRYVRLTVRQPALEYCTVLGTEFLIEVKNSNISLVPNDWTKISSTKAVSRFHTPFIVEKYKLLLQYREKLAIESNDAWIKFLESFSERYQCYRKAVYHVSTLDCLMSLAAVAQQHGFVRPEVVENETCVEIESGRHPVIQELLGENKQYVSNDTRLSVRHS